MKNKNFIAAMLLSGSLCLSGCDVLQFVPSSSMGNVGEALTSGQRFTLKNIDGDDVSLDQVLQTHKLVLLNFWATWCGYCVEEMPDLVKLQTDLSSRGFTILALNLGDSASQSAAFVKDRGLNFPVLLDTELTVGQAYGIVGIPVSILVDTKGKVLGQYNLYNNKMRSDIEKFLSAA